MLKSVSKSDVNSWGVFGDMKINENNPHVKKKFLVTVLLLRKDTMTNTTLIKENI